jgi:glycosyltransferase involved in cell wall biosynthesis
VKILHLATRDTGGSFKATYRLHKALQTLHINSDLLLAYKEHSYPLSEHIHAYKPHEIHWWKRTNFSLRYRFDNYRKRQILQQFTQKYEVFSFPQTVYRLHEHPLVQEADILHLHWVADFIDYPSFFQHIQKPIIWTLHDQNPFLGGLHYELDLQNTYDEFLQKTESELRKIKQQSLEHFTNFHIVATSQRMLENCQNAQVFSPKTQYHLIPCGLDTETFTEINRKDARKSLGLPHDLPIILFVAESVENKRKGFNYFAKLMQNMDNKHVNFCIVGKGSEVHIPATRNKVFRFAFVEDEAQLARIYAAADLLVVPSLQEAFGYTVIEAFACGTPVVAFDCVGAMDNMRDHADLFLARTGDSTELTKKVTYLLENKAILQTWRSKVRAISIEQYNQMHNAQMYAKVYQKALGIIEPQPKQSQHEEIAIL